MAEDLYQVLGVAKSASEQEIKKAYRRLAKQCHPDVNPGDASAEERFKKVTAAFDILSDARKRRLYDEFGADAARMGFDESKAAAYRAARAGPTGGAIPFEEGADLGELFREIFGQARAESPFGGFAEQGGRRRAARGEDLTTRMTVSLGDVVTGAEKAIVLSRPRNCSSCGNQRARRSSCEACGGTGREDEPRRLTVKLPAGVETGSRIRLAGQGADGVRGGPVGDLYIELEVSEHPTFRREGQDLVFDLPVTVTEAMLGAEVSIPTFEGRLTLKVPPGAQSGKKLRLKGKGVPGLKGGERGDLYAVIQIKLPEELNDEAREAARQLARAYRRDVRGDLHA